MMNFMPFLCADFGVAFPAIVSAVMFVVVVAILLLLWWVSKKGRTVKGLFGSMKKGFFKTGEAVTDFFTDAKVKTVYSNKSLNFSGTELLAIPSKQPNDKFTYEFVGWEKYAKDENGNPVIRAIFLQHTKKVYVNAYDDDRTTLVKSFEVEFGAGVDLTDVKLSKPSTNEFSYEFVGWDKDTKAFYKNENIYAVYKAIPKKFNYTFFDYDGKTVVSQGTALFGSPITPPSPPVRQNEDGIVFRFVGWQGFTYGILTKDCSFVAEFEACPEASVLGSTIVDINGEQIKIDSVQTNANVAEKPKKQKKNLLFNLSEKVNAPKVDFVDTAVQKNSKEQKAEKNKSVTKPEKPAKKRTKKSKGYSVLEEREEHPEPMLFGINMKELANDSSNGANPVVRVRKMNTTKASENLDPHKNYVPAKVRVTASKDDEDMKAITPMTAQKTKDITSSAKKKESEKSPLSGIMFNHVKISKNSKK